MSGWQSMETAPVDREIIGKNQEGIEATIWREKVHPKVDVTFWCCATQQQGEDWVKNTAFYPIAWRDAEPPQPSSNWQVSE